VGCRFDAGLIALPSMGSRAQVCRGKVAAQGNRAGPCRYRGSESYEPGRFSGCAGRRDFLHFCRRQGEERGRSMLGIVNAPSLTSRTSDRSGPATTRSMRSPLTSLPQPPRTR
jgi:hypothetical protein